MRISSIQVVLLIALAGTGSAARAFGSDLLPSKYYEAIRENSSGEIPFVHFRHIIHFSGYSPSRGADQVAEYISAQAKAFGLSNVKIEHFPADGRSYFWAFRTEPSWEPIKGELELVQPFRDKLASFDAVRASLGRYSPSADITGEVVDAGEGTHPEDYAGMVAQGKFILANGAPYEVARMVWQQKAAGILWYRMQDAIDHPDLVGIVQIAPWYGPHGEATPLLFSLSYRQAQALQQRLKAGEHLVVHADVKTQEGAGAYPEVQGEILGSDPSLPVVLVYAHDNSRNTGGANNLTGVGCTLEIAQLLNSLIQAGTLPRPRRTIRFMWGPEHFGITYHFHEHPDDVDRILVMINIDMIGYHQVKSKAVARLYRTPDSKPSFLNDVMQQFIEQVGRENSVSLRNEDIFSTHGGTGMLRPLFAPTGSQDPLQYRVEEFWGPSDHEDASTFGVPAILLNDFPATYLSTQDDTPEKACDPTQMRRGVVYSAAAAYFIASSGEKEAPRLVENALTKSRVRLAIAEDRSYGLINNAESSDLSAALAEAVNIVHQAYEIEDSAIESLRDVVGNPALKKAEEAIGISFHQEEISASRRITEAAQERAQMLGQIWKPLPLKSRPYSEMVPERSPNIRGPVSFVRPEYGRWWLIEKTGDEHFERKIALANYGNYPMYEALNLADGRRSVADIRDVLSFEFQTIPENVVAEYFQFLEQVGVIRVRSTTSAVSQH